MSILDQLADHARERVADAKAKSPLAEVRRGAEAMPRGDFPFEKLQLPGVNITDVRQAENVIRYYLGYDLPFADEAETAALEQSGAIDDMPAWPYDGSVRRQGELIVVNFSEVRP